MEQVLSQAEIDALLGGISDARSDGDRGPREQHRGCRKQVTDFDFIRFTKGKKERLPALSSIRQVLEILPLGLSCSWNARSRWVPRPHSTRVQEFIKTLPLLTNMNIVVTENLNGFFIAHFR